MGKEKACRTCRLVVEDAKKCPNCGSIAFTTFWRGYVMVTNPDNSEIASKMGIKSVGKYALRLSR